jgi:hypothetical protein
MRFWTGKEDMDVGQLGKSRESVQEAVCNRLREGQIKWRSSLRKRTSSVRYPDHLHSKPK